MSTIDDTKPETGADFLSAIIRARLTEAKTDIEALEATFNVTTGHDHDGTDSKKVTWANVDKTTSSIADITTKSHTALTDKGTNTHAQIDTHIAATAAHGISGAIVGDTDTQTLTNKTLTTPVIPSIYQDAGKTKLMTLPNTASDTLCAIAATQTLSNKTLTNPALTANSVITGVRFAGQHTDQSVTGTLDETTLATLPVAANTPGDNGILRVTTLWTVTNNANNKTLRIKFGGTTFGSIVVTTIATFGGILNICNRNATNVQVSHPSVGGVGTSTSAVVVGAVDTTSAQNIVITGELGNIADTITLNAVFVEVIK